MNVQVKHNGTNITGYIISYERQHKICTGIGNLQVEIDRTIPRTFDPWDTIDIYENGSFKVRYYISAVSDNIPKGSLVLDCQDISKRLVDYFIPDSYNIDYPTYTRYWIEKFLTEAGVTVTFNTTSPGNIISNNTQLGLQSAYEQILTLLQMSGWFIYFNQSEEAVVGPLNADMAISTRSIGKRDILNITRVSDDKMLRNRALVLGTFDPFTLSYASADVTVHTRWNYDHRDVRAVVISNSNIPNNKTAYGMANQIIKEFAKITIEKHITVAGAKNYNLGDAIRVTSTVWRGKGLITTFGTSMSKQGLVTNLVLDERCPRLFGFFDYGDYVYVGTYGDGVWKKHIKFDSTFSDFSSGLTDLAITDLHINNGVFSSVAASGEIYWTLEEGGWNQLVLSGLMSSAEETVASGAINLIPFSGLMGRATIVDKVGNTVKFGIDTYSGLNYGDYFLDHYTTSGITASGFTTPSGGYRGWIVEYDVLNGDYTGTAYPISYSGDYNVVVLDLENDGVNDYVSVRSGSASGVFIPDGYDLGNYNTTPFNSTFDQDAVVASPIPTAADPLRIDSYSAQIKTDSAAAFFDDAITDNRHMIHIKFNGDIVKRSYSLSGGSISGVTITRAFISSSEYPLAIHKLEFEVERYRVYYRSNVWNGNIYYKDWDVPSDTISGATTVFTDTDPNRTLYCWNVSINKKLYILYYALNTPSMSGGQNTHQQDLRVYVTTINLESGLVLSANMVYSYSTTLRSGSATQYEYFPPASHFVAIPFFKNEFMKFGLFQDGETRIKVLGWFEHGYFGFDCTEHLLIGDENSLTDTILKNTGIFRFASLANSGTSTDGTQLTRNKGLLSYTSSGSDQAFATNGDIFVIFTGVVPYYLDIDNIYPIYSRSQPYYIVINGSNFVACDALNLTTIVTINPPPDMTLRHPWSMPTTYGDEVFWYGWRTSTGVEQLIKSSTILDASGATTFELDFNGSTTGKGFNTGGWFIHGFSTSFSTPITYYYFVGGELEFPRYLVLQREGIDFNLIEQEPYPIRIDISNNSPLLTLGSGENSFVSNFVYDTEVQQIIYVSGNPIKVEDYRYTYLETTFSGLSGISTSGMPVQTMGLYVSESGVYAGDVTTYSGGFSIMYEVPSGYGNRIETSNYGLGGQYVFVTTSGDFPIFYQADPGVLGFTAYSGLPQSRATIIRLDDRI